MSVDVLKVAGSQVLCPNQLHEEVLAAEAFVAVLEYLNIEGLNVTFTFDQALTGPEDTQLDAILAGLTCVAAVDDTLNNTNIVTPLAGQTVVWDGTKWANTTLILNDNGDVDIVGPLADKELFVYNATSQNWENQTATEAGIITTTGLAAHTGDATIHFTESSIDHGSVAGLGDDDHAQYHNNTRGDARYYTQSQIDAHTGDASIHFTESSIDHGSITGLGDDDHTQYHNNTRGDARYYTQSQIDNHTGDATIHFTEASIDHTNIANIGTNTHAELDTFKAFVKQVQLDTLSSGVITGGVISNSSGIVIDVAAGTGCVNTGTTNVNISWGALTVSTVQDGTNYISIDVTNTVVASAVRPANNVIFLGHVFAAGGNTMIMEVFPVRENINNFPGRVHDYVADLQARVDGCTVSEKASPNLLELDIASGNIRSRLNVFAIPATSSFTKILNSSNYGWVPDTTNLNKVNNTYYNDPTQVAASALVPMTTGFWKKDVIILVPSGNVYYIYAQSEHQTLQQAELSALPSIPPEIETDGVYLATLVSQNGSVEPMHIDDVRPNIRRVLGYVENAAYARGSHEHTFGGFSSASTGLFVGGAITVNADPTKFDISAGTAGFMDHTTDPLQPTHALVSWSAQTAVAVTNILTQGATYIGIDITGAIIQSATPFIYEQSRSITSLSTIGHSTGTIEGLVANPHAAYDPAARLGDLTEAVGIINVKGNQYAANGVNLQLDKSSGKSHKLGVNFYTNPSVPDVSSDPAQVGIAGFPTMYRDGAGGYTVVSGNTIDPEYYDTDTGTLVAVPAGNWVVIPIWFFPGANATRVLYPQKTYASKAAAIADTPASDFVVPGNFDGNGTLRTFCIVQQGSTDLSDTAKAQFIQGGKFDGTVTGGSGGATGAGAPVDAAYVVTVSDPTLTNEKVIGTDFFITNTHISPSASITESKLALNFATHSNANDPSASEKAALVGTTGTASGTNRYVTSTDTRMTNARTPTSHLIINSTALGGTHTIAGGVSGYVFKATGSTTARLMQLSHTELSAIGTNTHAQIDLHIADGTLHFTKASIDHTGILNIGTNTHAQIDTHLGSTSNPHNTSIVNLTDTVITTPVNGNVLVYLNGNWVNQAKPTNVITVSSNDTTAGYLNGKLVAGTSISLVENNNGGNETLTVNNTAPNIVQDTFKTVTGNTGTTTANLPADTLNIVGGTGISTAVSGDTVTITSSAASSLPTYNFFAKDFVLPASADWNINAAPSIGQDPVNAALTVALFDDTIQEAVGFMVNVPSTATSMTVKTVARQLSGNIFGITNGTPVQTFFSTQATSRAINLPTYVAGDVVVIAMNHSPDGTASIGTVSIPSGWSQISTSSTTGAASDSRLTVIRKVMTGSEGSTVTVSSSTSMTVGAIAIPYHGVDNTTPLNGTVPAMTTGQSGNVSLPSITTVTDGARIVRVAITDGAALTNTQPAGTTQLGWMANNPPSNGMSLGAADRTQATAGATGTNTWSNNYNEEWVGCTFALRAAAPTPPPGGDAKMLLRKRAIPDNAAVTSWSSNALTLINTPTSNVNFQYDSTTNTLASWGLTAGRTYQIQISRDAANVADTIIGDLSLLNVQIKFT